MIDEHKTAHARGRVLAIEPCIDLQTERAAFRQDCGRNLQFHEG